MFEICCPSKPPHNTSVSLFALIPLKLISPLHPSSSTQFPLCVPLKFASFKTNHCDVTRPLTELVDGIASANPITTVSLPPTGGYTLLSSHFPPPTSTTTTTTTKKATSRRERVQINYRRADETRGFVLRGVI